MGLYWGRRLLGKPLTAAVACLLRCQLQVFLRMELCQQCPSLCESAADLEQMVEEASTRRVPWGVCRALFLWGKAPSAGLSLQAADLLRVVCLTQDSAYLAALLDQILGL